MSLYWGSPDRVEGVESATQCLTGMPVLTRGDAILHDQKDFQILLSQEMRSELESDFFFFPGVVP